MKRYQNIPILLNGNKNIRKQGIRYFGTTKYPSIPLSPTDRYVLTNFGDRLDLLAQQYYGDVSLYWIIQCANPNLISGDSLAIKPGSKLRIPINISDIIGNYQQLNSL